MKRDLYQIQTRHPANNQAIVLATAPGGEAIPMAKDIAIKTKESVTIRRCSDHWPVCRVTADGAVIFW